MKTSATRHLRHLRHLGPSLKLGNARRRTLYTILALLFLTGVFWLVFRQMDDPDGIPNPLEAWTMKLHGAMAMAALFVFGTMLYQHMVHAWLLGKNRTSGTIIATTMAFLIVTGYGLYYFNGAALRDATDWFHWVVGLVALPLLIWHISRGRKLSAVPTEKDE